MNTALWIIVTVFLVLFFSTGVATLLAIVKIGSKKKTLIEIDPVYLKRLFASLFTNFITT